MENIQLEPCPWAVGDDYLHYHNSEWGVPCFDRIKLFEKLCLEGQQAGLSWITVLRKRDQYRQCFYNFQPERVASMTDFDIEKLLLDPGLIRHRGKLKAIQQNAEAWLNAEQQGIDMVHWLWQFVDGEPKCHHYRDMAQIPAFTAESSAMSKQLKRLGFRFVGPTTCYAFMQSMGLVNDHLTSCPCHPDNQANASA